MFPKTNRVLVEYLKLDWQQCGFFLFSNFPMLVVTSEATLD